MYLDHWRNINIVKKIGHHFSININESQFVNSLRTAVHFSSIAFLQTLQNQLNPDKLELCGVKLQCSRSQEILCEIASPAHSILTRAQQQYHDVLQKVQHPGRGLVRLPYSPKQRIVRRGWRIRIDCLLVAGRFAAVVVPTAAATRTLANRHEGVVAGRNDDHIVSREDPRRWGWWCGRGRRRRSGRKLIVWRRRLMVVAWICTHHLVYPS